MTHRILFTVCLILASTTDTHAVCNSLNTAGMDARFQQALLHEVRGQKVRLAIFPFQDGSQIGADTTLEKGFAIAFYDLLKGNAVTVYHPFSVFNALRQGGITSADYFSDAKIMSAAASLGATHAVYGLFQKQEGSQVRYFIKIASLDQKKSRIELHEFATELSDRFFSVARDAASVIVHRVGKGRAVFGSVSEDPSFETFRYYLKGMEKSAGYNIVDLSIARVWFEKATTLSYTFRNGFVEMARTLFMEALVLKESGKDFSLQQSQGEALLASWSHGRGAKTIFALNPYRWMDGYEAYATGMSFFNNSQGSSAEKYLSQATRLVPEDGLAYYYLAKLHASPNNQQGLARQLNNCLP